MIHQGNTQPEENDPLKDAYQRLQEARDNCIKSDLNTCPLDKLTTLTEALKAAKEGFDKALEHDQKTNFITVGQHTIWKREFEALDSLAKLNGTDINEVLKGIQETENGRITQANFSNLGLTDISPLAPLTELKTLNLENNQIQDISILARLPQLKMLNLENNQIQDISTLARLPQLKMLNLENNQIQDISTLAQLTQLSWLYLQNNQIQDITSLAQLTQLKALNLRQNPIRNTIENHEVLKKLDQQALSHGGLFYRELEILQNLAELNGIAIDEVLKGIEVSAKRRITGAYFSNLGLVDISPLAQLTQLEWIALNNNQIRDISPLAKLSHLIDLGLNNNQIEDISPLANLADLKIVRLRGNKIQDITALAKLTKLGLLELGQNPIRNTIENHETLEKLKREFASRMSPLDPNSFFHT